MGELSRIGSLVIYLRFFDTKQHHKPHVHVKYNEDEAVVALDGKCFPVNCQPSNAGFLTDGWLCTKKRHTRPGILPFRESLSRRLFLRCEEECDDCP